MSQKDEISFRENPYQPQMDRIWINDSCAKTDLARWAFDDLEKDKKNMVYNSLREIYYLGFECGKANKAAEIKELFEIIKNAID
ncbi:unnamed protein product [marine sediment metagenome]|uniref:Uncharacterized protein n=1 Tax=marine sediment metagenome TaxID=412755 RepID=X0RFY6_9ZZZZ